MKRFLLILCTLAAIAGCDNVEVTKAERPTPGQWVDLGLPSGILWAGWNVGASRPEEYGGYYAWGETEEKNEYSFKTYKHSIEGDHDHKGDNCECQDYKDIIETSYDVATVKWGAGARMPTMEEVEELVFKCEWEEGNLNDIEGYYIIGPNGNSIFVPFAGYRYDTDLYYKDYRGYYWSGQQYKDYYVRYADDLYCYWGHGSWDGYYWYRYYGFTVRPVSD